MELVNLLLTMSVGNRRQRRVEIIASDTSREFRFPAHMRGLNAQQRPYSQRIVGR